MRRNKLNQLNKPNERKRAQGIKGTGIRQTAKGGRRKGMRRNKLNQPNEPNKPQLTKHKIQRYLTL